MKDNALATQASQVHIPPGILAYPSIGAGGSIAEMGVEEVRLVDDDDVGVGVVAYV